MMLLVALIVASVEGVGGEWGGVGLWAVDLLPIMKFFVRIE
jgi:hypothetical protein